MAIAAGAMEVYRDMLPACLRKVERQPPTPDDHPDGAIEYEPSAPCRPPNHRGAPHGIEPNAGKNSSGIALVGAG